MACYPLVAMPLRELCNPLTSRGPVSLPVVCCRLPFYGLRRGTPGAEAGYRLPVEAAQEQHVWI